VVIFGYGLFLGIVASKQIYYINIEIVKYLIYNIFIGNNILLFKNIYFKIINIDKKYARSVK
jgi:hypothetical protein